MKLSTDEMRFFKRNGYLIVRNILDPELMERARRRLWDGAPTGRTRDNPDRCQTAASDTAIARARSATATVAGKIDRGDGRATVDIERGLAPGAVAAIARRSRATVAMRRAGERIGDQRTTDNAKTRCAPRTVSAGQPIAAESIGQSGDVACAHQRTIGEDRSEAASSGAAQA